MAPPIKIEGRWWVNGTDAPPEFGTLASSDEDSLSLLVKIPQRVSASEVMERFEPADAHRDVVHGLDADEKPVTLFGCYALPHYSAGLISYKTTVLAAVQGLKLESWSQQCIRAVSIEVDLLHRWLGTKIVQTFKTADNKSAWTVPDEPDLLCDVCPDVRIRIVRFIGTSWSQDESCVRPRHRIWLHFATGKSLNEVTANWILWVSRLFSLLVGTSVRCREPECYIDDPYAEGHSGFPIEGKLIRRGGTAERETRDLHTQEMLAPYPEISHVFPEIIQTWHRVASDLEPVVDLFSTVTFHRSFHSEAEFLFLVQALEVYHARRFDSKIMPTKEHAARVDTVVSTTPSPLKDWTRRTLQGANYKHLDERLTDIFRRHAAEARRLFSDVSELPEKIRYTRNYLTHYTGNAESSKFLNNDEMIRVNWYLRVFIWICLLKEIGISGKASERLIRRYGEVQFVNL